MPYTLVDFIYLLLDSAVVSLVSLFVQLKIGYRVRKSVLWGVQVQFIYPAHSNVKFDSNGGTFTIVVNEVQAANIGVMPGGVMILHCTTYTGNRNLVRVNGVKIADLTFSDPRAILKSGTKIYIDMEDAMGEGFIHIWKPFFSGR